MPNWTLNLTPSGTTHPNGSQGLHPSWDGNPPTQGNPAHVGDSLTVTFQPPVWTQATTVALNLSWATSMNANLPVIGYNGTAWNGLCRWNTFVIPPISGGQTETYIFRVIIAHFPTSDPTDVSYYEIDDPTMVVRGGGGPLELK